MKFDALTPEILTHEYTEFYNLPEAKHLRFGQYICNKYLRDRETYCELYYEENNQRAFERAWKDLLDIA
jgi:hypothetical protein